MCRALVFAVLLGAGMSYLQSLPDLTMDFPYGHRDTFQILTLRSPLVKAELWVHNQPHL